MPAPIDALLAALQTWQEAAAALKKSKPSPSAAIANLQAAEAQVLALFARPEITRLIDEMLQTARSQVLQTPDALIAALQARRETLARQELKAALPLRLKLKHIERSLDAFFKSLPRLRESPALVSDRQALIALFEQINAALIEQYEQSLQQSRKRKKRRRKKLKQASLDTTLGCGLIAANSVMLPELSYPIAATALFRAVRTLALE